MIWNAFDSLDNPYLMIAPRVRKTARSGEFAIPGWVEYVWKQGKHESGWRLKGD